VLRLRDEADCLSSNRTEQSLRPHPSAGHRSKSPYRASGLVHRPRAVTITAPKRPVKTSLADSSAPYYAFAKGRSFFGRSNTSIAAMNTGTAARAKPTERVPDRSATKPIVKGPKKPPRFPTELMSAMPTAAEYPVRNSLGSAQKGLRQLKIPAANKHNRLTQKIGEGVVPNSKSAAVPTNAGIATWYRRSSLRSELRATASIAANASKLGIVRRSPTAVLE